MRPLYIMFEEAIFKARQARDLGDDSNALIKDGYVRLRKIVITPTRSILEAPELIMGNRILRAEPDNYPEERFLRVSFRDDDFSRLKSTVGVMFIKKFVEPALIDGIIVGSKVSLMSQHFLSHIYLTEHLFRLPQVFD